MSSLMKKLMKSSTLKDASVLGESDFFKDGETTNTGVPILNLALSGDLDGGLKKGLTVLAGPSKHFKTSYAIKMVSEFLKKHKEGVCLLYDCEFGTSLEQMENAGVDLSRVLHNPFENLEELKTDLATQLTNLEKEDKVIIVIDSVGNAPSKKEVDDAINQKQVADMTRAKVVKSIFRIVTPMLTTKDIPLIAINHTYQDINSMYGGQIVSSGTGIMYSANQVLVISRSQEKDSKGLKGYNFTLNVEKSRLVKEKSKFPVRVLFDSGIFKWSGLLELAIELGYVKEEGRSHIKVHLGEESKLWLSKASEEQLDEWYQELLDNTDFKEAVKMKYSLTSAGKTLYDDAEQDSEEEEE